MGDPSERLRLALATRSPNLLVLELARQLKVEGMSQTEMYRLFEEFRSNHESDSDNTSYDAILDTMDFISGWCPPEQRLFDTSL